jgi:predicted kinase
VRAHVIATQVEEGTDAADDLTAEARSYFDLALTLLARKPARLIAIGGLSGSGKTTVAEALAAHVGTPPGARIVESDRIRKAIHGVPVETRLPAAAYRPEVSQNVYREMAWRAGLILAQGGAVVADAVFDRKSNRDLIEKAAREVNARFTSIWLDADPATLWRRVAARQGGPSDATVDVLSRQLERKAEGMDWERIGAGGQTRQVVQSILALDR